MNTSTLVFTCMCAMVYLPMICLYVNPHISIFACACTHTIQVCDYCALVHEVGRKRNLPKSRQREHHVTEPTPSPHPCPPESLSARRGGECMVVYMHVYMARRLDRC